MKIGKFKMSIQYDMMCYSCTEYRSHIGFSVPLSQKPTAKILKAEGWTFVEGIGQICPKCSKRLKEKERA